MKIFISGGCKNGKSSYAENIARSMANSIPDGKLYYIATMRPCDQEDLERIEKHRKQRAGHGFITIEQPVNIAEISDLHHDRGTYLLDSVTALLANEMFLPDGCFNPLAGDKVSADLSCLLEETDNIVLVSDYIYSDANIYDEMTENYRRSLAHVDKTLAKLCDIVIEVAFGSIIMHKGRDLLDFSNM